MSNLISNSIKFYSENKVSKIDIKVLDHGNYCKIVVEDNGRGFDLKKHKSKIYEPFQIFSPEIKGKGLGLYLVKEQLEILNGKIYIQSEIDKGTRVVILLPIESQN